MFRSGRCGPGGRRLHPLHDEVDGVLGLGLHVGPGRNHTETAVVGPEVDEAASDDFCVGSLVDAGGSGVGVHVLP
eukprot:3346678-Rhodomonas_salina.1